MISKVLATCSFVLITAGALAQNAIVLKNQRELFADRYLVDNLHNIEQRLAVPQSGGIALKFDSKYEGSFSGAYISIINNGSKFLMYYRGVGEGKSAEAQVTCLAESTDGINWTKPELNQFSIKGSPKNNVVLLGSPEQSSHNFSAFYDPNPNVPAAERYKAVGGVASSVKRKNRGLYRYVSPDGIHWKRFSDSTQLFGTGGHGMDSQNILTWLPAEKSYAIYLRTWTGDKPGDTTLLKGIRTIARSLSKDFKTWSAPQRMTFGDTQLENLYTNATQPYFRAPQLLVSMPFRFSPTGKVLSDQELIANGIAKSMWKGVSDAVFMTSRGGQAYDRTFMESFVRPGTNQQNWAARSTIPACGVIPTGPSEMSFFVTRAYGTKQCHVERMALRTDGFASLHAGYKEGSVLTKRVLLDGNSFKLNYSTSSIGYVQVVLLDENGNEVPGFGLKNAAPIRGDKIDGAVTWTSGKTIKDIRDKTVVIKFIARDADIYSFGIFD